ncbi:trans-sulfuration enzyme family protein ASCRUDRAFT_75484 [Ascoidea rubescens DSM 1968]|uniref:cystathionine gamma-lyase n=1 Tax=Ascoidea rubescens DSM 1968 TaxID=1344418 RepID=A0A1D2VIL6_9ASCO|nr:hypothetical protein ASCRUDRAFT_75484 [Ascoidea rubescens DSM 1968]ODV61474.1 hypothetical protein ASCRUDRAFT_75484 [Ascoidea rubescens DSM 1968]
MTLEEIVPSTPESQFGFATKAIHVGSAHDPHSGAVISPISLSTTFAQSSPANPIGVYEYSRSQNPNREAFEKVIASLENGKYALAFSSGSAATANILQSLAQGSHVISVGDVYGGTHRYFTKVANTHGIKTDFTNDIITDLPNLIQDNTKLVWVETPSNPTLSITDISKVSQLLKSINPNIFLVVDNTFLSPYIQNPLNHGADIVVHSVTKYINGHSDVVMGVLATNSQILYERLLFLQNAIGAIPSPFDSWLAHRGVKTLHLRASRASSNALAIASLLQNHSNVLAVNYPGLKTHKNYKVVQKQHRDALGGGMISFRIKGGAKGAAKFVSSTKIFTLAESLGGIESLLEVPAVMTHAGIPVAEREKAGVFDDLIRLSVGVEDENDLLQDIKQALELSQLK